MPNIRRMGNTLYYISVLKYCSLTKKKRDLTSVLSKIPDTKQYIVHVFFISRNGKEKVLRIWR